MSDYNYAEFSTGDYNLDQFFGPRLGTKAPDFTLENANGHKVNLLDFKGDFLVLEMGSITCPLFQGRRETMSGLIEKHPHVDFSVLYVREAHPGKNIGAHQNIDDKKPIGDIVNLVSMARLIDGKGTELIIKTIAQLPNVHLKIIGDGPLKNKLKQLSESLNVQSRVDFLGWLNEEEKSNALMNSDIFCLPSIYDSFGVVFIEAMSLNLPIVAFNNGPVADIVKPHVGIVIEKYDVAHALRSLHALRGNIQYAYHQR